ncbi:MAG: hypothetical protein QOH91_3298 [Mycobacterium sp.]|nr:hypothetical protein [Mycobacterium sp.]
MPTAANKRSAAISTTAVTQENQVTRAAGGALMKLSLNAPHFGSRCAAVNPTALANPMATAACGAHRFPATTRATVIEATTI